MRRILPYIFSIFLVFTAVAEATHCHEQAAAAPCPAVCLSNCCGLLVANPDSQVSAVPVQTGIPAAVSSGTVFVHRISEDEIFHPPVV
ncbi:MAG: hypothetical protein HY550_04660 [Elusimicrobia bacterium]|nr:hypothetical protein [Elusimicrobiota bacterium]